MSTRYGWLLVLAIFALVGCAPKAGDMPPSDRGPSAAASEPPWPDQRAELGQKTYLAVCASCHDSGEGGAPRTGVKADWSGRSDMWQAVLFRHARDGYLAMPGKGGADDLDDASVDAASEYILEQTFPDRPRD